MRILSPLPARFAGFVAPLALGLAFAGCDDASSSGYRAFDASNQTEVHAWIGAYETMKAKGEEAVAAGADIHTLYTDIANTYTNSGLQAEIVERTDPHAYDPIAATFGQYVDRQITRAILMAHAAYGPTATSDLEYAEETIDKLLQVFFYVSLSYELDERSRAGVDEAYAWYGLPAGGKRARALSATAGKRELEYGVSIDAEVAQAFLDARAAMAAGTSASTPTLPSPDVAYDAAAEAIDHQGLRILAYSVKSYLEQLRDAPTTDPDVHLLEARAFWFGLEPYAASVAPSAATALDALLYPAGKPAIDGPGVHFVSGLAEVRSGARVIDAVAALAQLDAVFAALGE